MKQKQMTMQDRYDVVMKGLSRFGWDFFMIDTRGTYPVAAPFRIAKEKDLDCFVTYASPFIPWEASRSAIERTKEHGERAVI